MERPIVYFNPGCGQARGALEILRARGVEFDVIEYLKTPLARGELERMVTMLDAPPAELVRKDKRFAALGLDAEAYRTADQVVTLLLEHPELMQRPVVVRGGRAVIARPAEKVLEFLGIE
ncbi:MAG: hypothetical protein QOD06_430 [Candidatus Binatota bacterium]|nr:hypothetical protein [Candidatus Binatota bacterium]